MRPMIHGKYWTFDNRAALYPKLIASVILSLPSNKPATKNE
jgi:hypothetical protein